MGGAQLSVTALLGRLQAIVQEAWRAAFFGLRQRGGDHVLVKLSLALVAVLALLWGTYLFAFRDTLAAIASAYPKLVIAISHGRDSNAHAVGMPAATPLVALVFFFTMIAHYVALAAYEAGCLRWIIRGETRGFLGLDFGPDTRRVWATYWIWIGLRFGASIIIAAITYVLAAVAGGPETRAGENAELVWLFVQDLVILFFALRLSPAAALAVGRKRISFFEAWRVTRGRALALLAAFLILVALLCFVAVFTVGGALVVVYGQSAGRIVEAAQAGDMATMIALMSAPLASPGSLIVLALALLLNQALSMVFYVLFYAVNAYAVIQAARAGAIDGVTLAPETGAMTGVADAAKT